MKDAFLNMVKNWKTTLSGMVVLFLLYLYLGGHIDKEQMETAIYMCIGLGLIASKDGSNTGVIKDGKDVK